MGGVGVVGSVLGVVGVVLGVVGVVLGVVEVVLGMVGVVLGVVGVVLGEEEGVVGCVGEGLAVEEVGAGRKICTALETWPWFCFSSTALKASTYFSPTLKSESLMKKVFCVPPFSGSRVESLTKSLSVITVLNSSLSKFPPVRLPTVLENFTMYLSALSSESRSSPGAVKWTATMWSRFSTWRSVTLPGGRLSASMSTSLVTLKAPPAACLQMRRVKKI